jgi:hypothetical protein
MLAEVAVLRFLVLGREVLVVEEQELIHSEEQVVMAAQDPQILAVAEALQV